MIYIVLTNFKVATESDCKVSYLDAADQKKKETTEKIRELVEAKFHQTARKWKEGSNRVYCFDLCEEYVTKKEQSPQATTTVTIATGKQDDSKDQVAKEFNEYELQRLRKGLKERANKNTKFWLNMRTGTLGGVGELRTAASPNKVTSPNKAATSQTNIASKDQQDF